MFIADVWNTIDSSDQPIDSTSLSIGISFNVASRNELRWLDPVSFPVVDVYDDGGQSGRFYFRLVGALPERERLLMSRDTLEGVYVQSYIDPRYVAVRQGTQQGFDPAWFGGAYNDPYVDNSQALAAAIRMGTTRIGDGYLYCSTALSFTNQSIRLLGNGMGQSEIRWSSKTGTAITCINSRAGYIPGTPIWNLSVMDMDITTLSDPASTKFVAFESIWPDGWGAYRFLPMGGMTRVNFRGVDTENTGWNGAVRLRGVLNYQFYECYFNGKDEGGSRVQAIEGKTRSDGAIYADGGWTPCEVKFFGCHFNHWKKPIDVSGSFEGLYLTQCTLVQVLDGITWNATTYAQNYPLGPSAKGRPYFAMSNTHINAYRHGVVMDGVVQGSITGSALYQNRGVENGTMVSLTNGSDWMIIGNTFRNYCDQNIVTHGVVVGNNVGYTTILGNNFDTRGSGILYQADGIGHNIQDGNTFRGSYTFGSVYNPTGI